MTLINEICFIGKSHIFDFSFESAGPILTKLGVYDLGAFIDSLLQSFKFKGQKFKSTRFGHFVVFTVVQMFQEGNIDPIDTRLLR